MQVNSSIWCKLRTSSRVVAWLQYLMRSRGKSPNKGTRPLVRAVFIHDRALADHLRVRDRAAVFGAQPFLEPKRACQEVERGGDVFIHQDRNDGGFWRRSVRDHDEDYSPGGFVGPTGLALPF